MFKTGGHVFDLNELVTIVLIENTPGTYGVRTRLTEILHFFLQMPSTTSEQAAFIYLCVLLASGKSLVSRVNIIQYRQQLLVLFKLAQI